MRDITRNGIANMNEATLARFTASLDIHRDSTAEEVADFLEEREGLHESLEHDILDSIENGSYTLAVEQMRSTEGRYIFPLHLINWLEGQDLEDEGRWAWYDLATHDSLCQLFWKDHHEKATYRD